MNIFLSGFCTGFCLLALIIIVTYFLDNVRRTK